MRIHEMKVAFYYLRKAKYEEVANCELATNQWLLDLTEVFLIILTRNGCFCSSFSKMFNCG